MIGALGTALEYYDFTLYVYLAPVLAGLFFPSGDSVASLIATFGVFAAGYLMRPLGALFFGHLGDTRGRGTALRVSVAMMSAPMLVLALLPTETTIGIAAPVALVIIRLVQGFSVGGEFTGAIVLLDEIAPAGRRGYTAGIAESTSGLGVLLAAGTATALHAVLSGAEMHDWGWRIPFGIGVALGLFTFAMRLRMPTTPAFAAARESGALEHHPIRAAFRFERVAILRVLALTAYMGIAYYLVATWLPSYLQSVIGARPEDALLATTIGAIAYVVLCLPAGALSDRVGRRPMLLTATRAFAVLSLPLLALVASTDFARILAGTLALMVLVVWLTGPFTAAVGELFPTATRFSGMGIGYNVGIAVFGGTAPLIATALAKVTGWELAPALYLIAASLLLLPVIARMPETYLRRFDDS